MKKLILISGLLLACCGLSVAKAGDQHTLKLSLAGTLVEGSQQSVTYGPNGSVTLSADCTTSYSTCAEATVTVTDKMAAPAEGCPTKVIIYDSFGSISNQFTGTYISHEINRNPQGGGYFEFTIENAQQDF